MHDGQRLKGYDYGNDPAIINGRTNDFNAKTDPAGCMTK